MVTKYSNLENMGTVYDDLGTGGLRPKAPPLNPQNIDLRAQRGAVSRSHLEQMPTVTPGYTGLKPVTPYQQGSYQQPVTQAANTVPMAQNLYNQSLYRQPYRQPTNLNNFIGLARLLLGLGVR